MLADYKSGMVVQTGSTIGTITPENSNRVIEAYVSTMDMARMKEGDMVQIVVDGLSQSVSCRNFCPCVCVLSMGGFVSLASALGFSRVDSFKNSIMNGIDVKDGLDTETIAGVKRYVIFRAIYAAVTVF